MCWLSWVWLGSHFGCDYTDYYYILVAAEWCKSLLYFLFCWVGWGCTGGWEGTQLGQLIPTDQKDIPYCLISCSAIKLPGFLSKDSLPRWSGHCSAYEIVWVNPFYSAFFPLPFFPSPSLSWSIRGFFAFSHPILPSVLLQGGDRGNEQMGGAQLLAGVNPWHCKQNHVLYALFHSPHLPINPSLSQVLSCMKGQLKLKWNATAETSRYDA